MRATSNPRKTRCRPVWRTWLGKPLLGSLNETRRAQGGGRHPTGAALRPKRRGVFVYADKVEQHHLPFTSSSFADLRPRSPAPSWPRLVPQVHRLRRAPAVGTPLPATATNTTSLAVGSTPSSAAGQPKTGGTLRVGIPSDITTLDGIVRGGSPYESIWLIYDRLVTYDDKLKPLPMLAESWDLSPDYKQIKLNLRHGVQWHTGREFTSDDVKWNIVRVQDPKAGNGDFAAQASWFTAIDTPDKYTVVLQSDQSRPSIFDFFQQFNLVDRTIMEGPDAKTRASWHRTFQVC